MVVLRNNMDNDSGLIKDNVKEIASGADRPKKSYASKKKDLASKVSTDKKSKYGGGDFMRKHGYADVLATRKSIARKHK